MNYHYHNTDKRTNKHLNQQKRYYIQCRLRENDSIASIAATLGRSRTTIYNELKRGTVDQRCGQQNVYAITVVQDKPAMLRTVRLLKSPTNSIALGNLLTGSLIRSKKNTGHLMLL